MSFGAVEGGEEGVDSLFVGVLGAGLYSQSLLFSSKAEIKSREIEEVSYVAKPDLYTPLLMSL